jgi:WYL_2, Sm-like SH3 beta-barrel fold
MLNSLTEQLHNGIVEITFDKVDGTRRVMKCTLNQDYIRVHTESVEKSENTRKHKEGVLVVFDTEKNDWRSMRVDSIISYR